MLEDSINFNIDQIKIIRFKSAKTITSLNYNPKIKEIISKKSHSYDNINKKSETKINGYKNFPISESYSIISNSHEDIHHYNFKAQSNKYKKSKTFEHNEPEIKKNCSSNVVNSTNKIRQEFLVEDNKETAESNLKIKIKRPNFLIKSCFFKKNSEIYQSKIGRAMSKKENSPVFNFFRDIDVEPNMDLLKKNYKLSSFSKPIIKNNKKNKNENNNILNDELLNDNEELIKIIKADSSDDEKEVKSFHGDNFDFANEIDKINKLKEKDDTLNDSINIIKNNSSIYSAQNYSEGLNNSTYLNRSLNEDFAFKNHSKIFRTNTNNLSLSLNNSMVKQEEKNYNASNDNNNEFKNKENGENQWNYNYYINNINNSNYNNNDNNFDNYQNFKDEVENQSKNISYQSPNIFNDNETDKNKNIINNNVQYENRTFINQKNENFINYQNKSNNYLNQNNLQHPYINNTINYIFQNNTNLFYNNNPFFLKNSNINTNIPYNYFPLQFNNINNQKFPNQFNPIINENVINNYNNYYNQNNNIYNYNNNILNNYNKNRHNSFHNKVDKSNIFENYKDLSKISNFELAKISHILAKKKEGSKYLENIIESNPYLASSLFFPHSLANFEEISNNKFGNFYIKKIIKYLNKELLSKLIEFINPLIIRLGTNQYGSKIIEQLIKSIKDDDNLLLSFIQKIIPNLTLLINDLNGTHIIYKLILLKSKNKNLVEEHIMKNIKNIYISREGSNLLKKFFDIINKECNTTKDYNKMILFINIINNNLPLIITDQFGNYIIRHIIHHLNNFINEILYKNIIANLIYFSNQKYSSNVVENCLDNIKFREMVMEEFSKQYVFNCVFLNEYGNYVVQKVLSLVEEDKKNILFNYIIQASKQMKTLPFGPKLISKLLMNYPNLSIYLVGMNYN